MLHKQLRIGEKDTCQIVTWVQYKPTSKAWEKLQEKISRIASPLMKMQMYPISAVYFW